MQLVVKFLRIKHLPQKTDLQELAAKIHTVPDAQRRGNGDPDDREDGDNRDLHDDPCVRCPLFQH